MSERVTIKHLLSAITGFVRMGATIEEMIVATGLSVEAINFLTNQIKQLDHA